MPKHTTGMALLKKKTGRVEKHGAIARENPLGTL